MDTQEKFREMLKMMNRDERQLLYTELTRNLMFNMSKAYWDDVYSIEAKYCLLARVAVQQSLDADARP